MAVALDANSVTPTTISAATSATNTTLTVGASATCLLGFLIQETACTAQTMHWDSTGTNQLMTLIGSKTTTNGWIYLFGLVSPTTGNHTLSSSWTTSCFTGVLTACSFTGSATASVAAAFKNFNSNSATGTSVTLVMTGATGNISVCAEAENQFACTLSATGASSLFNVTGVQGQASQAPSAASLTWTGTTSSSATIALAGVDVAAAPIVNLMSYLRPPPLQIWDH